MSEEDSKSYDSDLFKNESNSKKDENNSEEYSGKINEKYSGKSNSNDDDDKRRNEVRKEFTLEFEKRIAKYIPPKIYFKGNVSKRTLILQKDFGEQFISNLTLFKNYILISVEKEVHFYNKELSLIFKQKFLEGNEEILGLNPINDETIVISATDKVRIVNFYEKENNKIEFEIIQEIGGTEFYALNETLSNGLLLLCGFNRKYGFYELVKKKEKVSKNNKFQLQFSIDLVHNVYDDDAPGIVDLNNGRIFSWLNDDKNIKVIEYSPAHKARIIKSKNGIGLHNAGLICDKYILLMGLIYPIYYSWLMDTETLEIVKKWETPDNDSFNCSLCENKFIYSSTYRIACDEFYIKDGDFFRKNIYETYYNESHSEDWENSYGVETFLNENTFVAINSNGKLMIFSCNIE